MRSSFSILLIATLIFGGGFFYNLALAVCPIPLEYRIGVVDQRFDLTVDEAKLAVAEAAEVWESATGQNLFSYDADAVFTVNFVFDDRQALLNEEEQFRDSLDEAESVNDALTQTHDSLVTEYNKLKESYNEKIAAYEKRLAAYNKTVARYNQEGGAPAEVYDELEAEKQSLNQARSSLDGLAGQLNNMVDQINAIGEKGNALIANYNNKVGEFNNQFGEGREFTQGDYQGDRINIYTYKDFAELQTVLVHELGHALSLGHVAGDDSVMYYLIGGQPSDIALSENDLAEFNRVCGDMSLWDKIVYRLTSN